MWGEGPRAPQSHAPSVQRCQRLPSGGSQRVRAQRWPLTEAGEAGEEQGGNLGPRPPASGAGSASPRRSSAQCPRHAGPACPPAAPPGWHLCGAFASPSSSSSSMRSSSSSSVRSWSWSRAGGRPASRVSSVTCHESRAGGRDIHRGVLAPPSPPLPLGRRVNFTQRWSSRTAPGARGPLLAHRQIFPGGGGVARRGGRPGGRGGARGGGVGVGEGGGAWRRT